MKLIRCFVENFGTLSKESMEFDSGLCCTYKENGSGKTTMAVFIKAMLFGLEVSTKRKLDENERNKYRPWNGLSYGGWLEFYSDSLDKSFRVTRFFADKASLDTCEIIDLSTGLDASKLFEKGQIGQKLFGIDETGFEQTLFLSEKDVEIKNNGSITTKISALASGDDDSFEVAVKILDTKRKYYKNSAGRGIITDLEDELNKKKRDHESLCALSDSIILRQEELRDKKNRADELEKLIKNQKDEAAKLHHAIEIKEKQLNLVEIEKNLLEVNSSIEALGEKYRVKIPDENTISGIEEEISSLETLLSQSRTKDIESLEIEIDSLEKKLWDVKIPREDIPGAIEKYSQLKNGSFSELENEVNDAKNKVRDAEKKYRQGVPTSDEIEGLCQINCEISEWKLRKNELSEEYLEKIKEEQNKSGKSNPVALCIALWTVAAVSVLPAILIFSALWILTAILGALAAIFTFRLMSQPKKANASEFEKFESSRDEIEEKIEDLEEEKQKILEKYSLKADVDPQKLKDDLQRLESDRANALELEQSLLTQKQKLDSLCVEYRDLVGRYARSDDPQRSLLELASDLDKLGDKKSRKEDLERDQQELEGKISRLFDKLEAELSDILTQSVTLRDTQTAKRIVSAIKNDGIELLSLEKEKNRLQELLARESIDTNGCEELLSDSLEELTQRLKINQNNLANWEKEFGEIRLGIATGGVSLETLIDKCEDLTAVEQEISVINEKLKTASSENYTVCMALEHLEKAKNSLSSRYVKAIEENFKGLVTTSDNQSVKLDTKLSMKVEKEGQLREMACFSRGQRDVIDFSLRMALVKTLFEGGERPFIILDDPFSALDKNNFEKAADTVRELSKDYQIIYTVCAEERAI